MIIREMRSNRGYRNYDYILNIQPDDSINGFDRYMFKLIKSKLINNNGIFDPNGALQSFLRSIENGIEQPPLYIMSEYILINRCIEPNRFCNGDEKPYYKSDITWKDFKEREFTAPRIFKVLQDFALINALRNYISHPNGELSSNTEDIIEFINQRCENTGKSFPVIVSEIVRSALKTVVCEDS